MVRLDINTGMDESLIRNSPPIPKTDPIPAQCGNLRVMPAPVYSLNGVSLILIQLGRLKNKQVFYSYPVRTKDWTLIT